MTIHEDGRIMLPCLGKVWQQETRDSGHQWWKSCGEFYDLPTRASLRTSELGASYSPNSP